MPRGLTKPKDDYNKGVLRGLLVLLFCPAWAFASCGAHRVPHYDLLMRQNRYAEALRLVLTDLNATTEEKNQFKILPVSDEDQPDTLSITPSILQKGKSAVCQEAASELERLHSRQLDRRRLNAYHEEWIAAQTGWIGCDTTGKDLNQPAEAAKVAYHCLEDRSLATHQAAIDIRALLARSSAGDVPRLNDEDADTLQQQLRAFHEAWSTLDDKSSNSYYIPEIKRSDRIVFCRAVSYTRQTLQLRNEETASWQQSCRQLAVDKK